jgi:hypothetical protein
MSLGCCILVGVGICFVMNPSKFESFIMRSSAIIFISGVLGIIFFGIVGFFILKKIGDKSPGLIISDEGIMENAMYTSVGFIPWSDVIKIENMKIANQMFIGIILRNPNEYIEKQKSGFKRKVMQTNYKKFGTPIGISTNGLKANHNELKTQLEKKFADFNSR